MKKGVIRTARRRRRRRAKLRAAAFWAIQMWTYETIYELPYRKPWRRREHLRIDYPIRLDSAIGAGTPPPQRLQRALRRPPAITALDRAVAALYWMWEAEPHAALLWILIRREEAFRRAAALIGGTFWGTFLFHAVVPTAPPWWASEVGNRMDREVRRVMIEVSRDLRGESRLREQYSMGSNPWASMPSNHLATAAATAMVVSELDPRAGAAAWTYAGALGFALVYLGEHYVCDLFGGLAAALLVRAGLGRFVA